MFDFVEEALDEIAFAIERVVTWTLDRSVCLGRDNGVCAALDDGIDDVITVIPLVSQHILRGDAVQQPRRLRTVGNLALRKDEPHRIAQSIAQSMKFGG